MRYLKTAQESCICSIISGTGLSAVCSPYSFTRAAGLIPYVRVLRAKRTPSRSFPILPLQSAVQRMPREAARFLCPDWLISGGADDLHCRVTLDSSNW
jgi:hypothetical protein